MNKTDSKAVGTTPKKNSTGSAAKKYFLDIHQRLAPRPSTVEGLMSGTEDIELAPVGATSCPDSGSVKLSDETLRGIDALAEDMQEGVGSRLRTYLQAAVFAGQAALDKSGLDSARSMFEYLLAGLVDDLSRCCNMQLASHFDGRDIFAENKQGNNAIL